MGAGAAGGLAQLGMGYLSTALDYVGNLQAHEQLQRQVAEQRRRRGLQIEQTMGAASSRAYATGFDPGSESIKSYLAGMRGELDRQDAFDSRAEDAQLNASGVGTYFGFVKGIAGSTLSFLGGMTKG